MLIGLNEGGFPSGSSGFVFLMVFIIIFLLVTGFFVVFIAKSLIVWTSNNNAPVQDRFCKVVAKRLQLSNGLSHSSSAPSYFVTFEFEDRSRLELCLGRQQFGYIVEGDQGVLTLQGTRFREFERRQAV